MSWITRYVVMPVTIGTTMLLSYACGQRGNCDGLQRTEEKRIQDSINIESYAKTLAIDTEEVVLDDGKAYLVTRARPMKGAGGLPDSARIADSTMLAEDDTKQYMELKHHLKRLCVLDSFRFSGGQTTWGTDAGTAKLPEHAPLRTSARSYEDNPTYRILNK